MLAGLLFSPEDVYVLADKFTKNTKYDTRSTKYQIYQEYFRRCVFTRCVVAAVMLHVLESETQRYGPKCGEATDSLCWGLSGSSLVLDTDYPECSYIGHYPCAKI
jgi:hypothetical protein